MSAPVPGDLSGSGGSGGSRGDLTARVHALLFASSGPLSVERLCALTGAEAPEVRRALACLHDHYSGEGAPGGVVLQEVAGGFQLTTAPAQVATVLGLGRNRPQPLSPAALETLAVIAYKQPITRAAIEAIRGVGVDGVLATLLDRGLIREAGRKQAPGRPLLYATSAEFLRILGLRSLSELPQPEPDPSPREEKAFPA